MHSEGYSSCSVCVSVSLRHSSGTHATNLPMDRVSCSLQNLNCFVAKLEHFLQPFRLKRAILRTSYTTLVTYSIVYEHV